MNSTVSRATASFKHSSLTLLAAVSVAMSSAHAAPPIGPSDASFYNPPAAAPMGLHGDLISYRPATVKLGHGAPAFNAWNVMYTSEDADGEKSIATGTVVVPTGSASGPHPIILYAMGTHGLGNDCAPSKQLATGAEYENANIAAALKAGFAVLITDYAGYTTGALPHFMAGPSQGRNVLDMFKAATGIPGSGISAASPVAIWGYSQGGQSAAFAAELQPSYAPELKLVAVAHGGTPGDFFRTANYLNARNGSAFLFKTVAGLNAEYPTSIPFDLAISPAGRLAYNKLKDECIFKALFEFQNQDIASYTNPGFTLDKLLSLKSVKDTLTEQTLGTQRVGVPMYQYHGQADEFIPLDQAIAMKKRYCAQGTDVTFDLYPSEHIVTQFQAAPTVLSWLKDRFDGKPAQGTCGNAGPEPVSTANDNTGNLIVSLARWPLAASVDLKTLKQTVVLPDTSVFTADSDVTTKKLSGHLSVPDFKQSLKLLGIGAQIGLRITPVGDTTGEVSLDEVGVLRVDGNVKTDLTVTSVWGIPFGQCKTAEPVNFPLNFEGPISSLGDGLLTFTGTTSFPQIKGCIISAIISAFMSGNGQNYRFTVSPPAPKRY